jgi:alpha-galactosidase
MFGLNRNEVLCWSVAMGLTLAGCGSEDTQPIVNAGGRKPVAGSGGGGGRSLTGGLPTTGGLGNAGGGRPTGTGGSVSPSTGGTAGKSGAVGGSGGVRTGGAAGLANGGTFGGALTGGAAGLGSGATAGASGRAGSAGTAGAVGVGGGAGAAGSAGAPRGGGGATGTTGGRGGSAGSGGSGTGGGGATGGGSTALAATPPMGWNSWNRFASNFTAADIMRIADAMVSSGMAAVGYQYVNIDDTWQASARDSNGNIVADPAKFPNGMQEVADHVHTRGLKLGIYSDRGTQTCSGRPGSYGYETRDAQMYASWGVDYLKYDNCYIPAGRENDPEMQIDYTAMRDALQATGRPIVYSICAWWFHPWMPSVGQLWRTTTDITDTWASVISLLDKNGGWINRYSDASYDPPGLAQYAGPGHWNDPDMLEVGNGGMTDTEYRSHFSLWALMAAPLIAGNDLTTMSDATRQILTNTDVIAVNQDPLGRQGVPISTNTTLEVWSKQLSGTQTYAVILFNRSDAAAAISVTWSELGITTGSATVRDLWTHADLGSIADGYTANVPSHGVVMLRVVGS